MVEIHHDNYFLTRFASVIPGDANWVSIRVYTRITATVFIREGLSDGGITTAGADPYFQIARLGLGGTIFNQHSGCIVLGHGVDGLKAGLVLVSTIRAAGLAVDLLPSTGYRVTYCLSGDVLY